MEPTVTLIPGDGICPEVVRATPRVIEAAGAARTTIFESGVRTANIGGGASTSVLAAAILAEL